MLTVLFPILLAEIRLPIWRVIASEPRVVTVQVRASHGPHYRLTRYNIPRPALLDVNCESREVYIRYNSQSIRCLGWRGSDGRQVYYS
jgi:hypothetical protein